jgi:hypothetical protein
MPATVQIIAATAYVSTFSVLHATSSSKRGYVDRLLNWECTRATRPFSSHSWRDSSTQRHTFWIRMKAFRARTWLGRLNCHTNFSDTSLESVRSLVGEKNVSFIKGRFPGTANAIPDAERFCLVNLDCDLYAPFSAALQYIYPRLLPGGFLIMHDYSSLHSPLIEKAID